MKKYSFLIFLLLNSCAEIGLEPNGVPAPPPPRPILQEPLFLSPTFGASLIVNQKIAGLKMTVFVVGEGEITGDKLSEYKSQRALLKPPVMAYLIDHPQKGKILFGTGLPEDLDKLNNNTDSVVKLKSLKVPASKDILTRLSRQHIPPEIIRWVILPDMSPEWSGRARAFPEASVVLSSKAWLSSERNINQSQNLNLRSFIPEEKLKLFTFEHDEQFGPFKHGHDLFSDGTVIAVDLEGTSIGGIGLWVNLDSGPVLLTGPSAFVYDNIFDDALPDRNYVNDINNFAWNARAMKTISQALPRLIIAPAFDLSPFKISPRPDINLLP